MVRFAFYSLAAATIFIGACSSGSSDTPPGNDASAGGGTGTGGGAGAGGSSDFPSVNLDGGGTVPDPPDGASLCPPGACNYQTGQGCSGATTCTPVVASGASTPTCQPAGTVPSGGACTSGRADCAPGTFCAAGTCHKLCCGSGVYGDYRACPEGEHCLRPLVIGGAGASVATGAYLCFPVNQCDALDPATGCAAGTTCQLVDPTGATACAPEGMGTPGEPCPCKGGFFCVGNGCRRLCRAAADGGVPACPPEEGVCTHFNRDPVGVGECTPS
jgi:hypothetical protein